VFQEPSSHLNPLMTLGAQLSEGSLAQGPPSMDVLRPLWKPGMDAELEALLRVYPKPYRPSGGEKQRMLIAMAFKQLDALQEGSPNLFVFDEPTGSLDNEYRNIFLSQLFARHLRKSFTCLLVTHDYSMISRIMSRHREMLPRIVMRELVLRDSGLSLRDFRPETYTGWLRSLHPVPASINTPPLLHVDGRIVVHGRPLRITQEDADGEAVPLLVRPGRLTYLKGPSGEGKTSFVKALMGLVPSTGLRCVMNGLLVTEHTPRHVWRKQCWGKRITMVFQHADEALNGNATVQQTLEAIPVKLSHRRIAQFVGEFFGMNLPAAFLNRRVATLSGGQKQRLNLLRGLILDTDVAVLDEPLNALDFESGTRVIEQLNGKLGQGKGILVISHNEEIFNALVDEKDVYYLVKEN